MKKENIKKVVLAYSGGLDTSIIIPWLKENYNNCEVVAVSGDVGQGTELDGLEEKAKATGASKLYVLDLKKDFVENYIFPTLKFGAKYEDYLLGTSFARPCIAKALADIAIKEGADAICHGCTGKGNDQVRFELTLKALCPDMAIIAPWREWDIKSRDEEIDYAEAHHIPLKINRETNYSKDKNLWHLSHEGLDLESPANEPQYNKPGFLELGISPEQAPDVPTYVTIHFEKGIPTAVDGKEMESVAEYLGKSVLREVDEDEFMKNIADIRSSCGDRAVLRAMHFYGDNARVEKQAAALKAGDFETFKKYIIESGRSSYMYNQNVYSCKKASEQPVSLALSLSEKLLDGCGAWRVHGGGFAGTIQAFVPLNKLDEYKDLMEKVFGSGSCYILSVRPVGGVEL